MKRLAKLTLIAMMEFGMNVFSVNAYEEPTKIFNFKTGEYELVQPRAVVCYCRTVMDTWSVEKVYDTYGQPCQHGHPGYEDVVEVIHRVTEGRCPNCGNWKVIKSQYLRTKVHCGWNI